MSSRRLFLAVTAGLLLALTAAQSAAQKPFDDPALERIRKDVFFLAGPECEGRGVETKGIEKAADYVVEAFKQAGLKPAMKDGSYFQPFTIAASAKLAGVPTLTLTAPAGAARDFEAGTDFTAMGYSSTSKAAGGLVFVGYGITAAALKYDDYAGLDVAGKVVVMLRRSPRYSITGEKRFDTTTTEGTALATFDAKIENAIAHKVAGMIIVNDVASAGKTDPIPQFANHASGTTPAPFPVLFMKREALDSLIATGPIKSVADIETLIDTDLKPRSFELTGWKAATEVTVTRTEYKPKNIIGVLEGAGPLADETVVIGGHYDHIGFGEIGSMAKKADRGKVHLGADDNASGTAGVIELARRYGAMKDRQGRRLVFIAFSGEERGLIGSMYYCKNPVFPIEKTVGMINLDMVGRVRADDWLGIWGSSKDDRLHVYGTGTGAEFAKLVQGTAGKVPFRLTTNESASLGAGGGGSDHESFYMKRIPVLFLFSGYHPQYHAPTDTPERINVPGINKVADFAQQLADHMLVVDPKPEYRVVRAPAGSGSAAGPKGPRMGVIPDYNFMEETGMRLSGVSPGGPAEKGGLKEDDLIVEIGGKPVKNVTGYMTVMGAQKAGAALDVVVLRKGEKVTLKVTPE